MLLKLEQALTNKQTNHLNLFVLLLLSCLIGLDIPPLVTVTAVTSALGLRGDIKEI